MHARTGSENIFVDCVFTNLAQVQEKQLHQVVLSLLDFFSVFKVLKFFDGLEEKLNLVKKISGKMIFKSIILPAFHHFL